MRHPSACCPGRPPHASPRCRVRQAQLPHPCCSRSHGAALIRPYCCALFCSTLAPTFNCTPGRATIQWPTTGAPKAFAWQDSCDGDCARGGCRAPRPTEGTPVAQFAQFSGLRRKGKDPQQNWGGTSQGPQCCHRAAQITQATAQHKSPRPPRSTNHPGHRAAQITQATAQHKSPRPPRSTNHPGHRAAQITQATAQHKSPRPPRSTNHPGHRAAQITQATAQHKSPRPPRSTNHPGHRAAQITQATAQVQTPPAS